MDSEQGRKRNREGIGVLPMYWMGHEEESKELGVGSRQCVACSLPCKWERSAMGGTVDLDKGTMLTMGPQEEEETLAWV